MSKHIKLLKVLLKKYNSTVRIEKEIFQAQDISQLRNGRKRKQKAVV